MHVKRLLVLALSAALAAGLLAGCDWLLPPENGGDSSSSSSSSSSRPDHDAGSRPDTNPDPEPLLTGITAQLNTVYQAGDSFSARDLTVTGHYDDHTSAILSPDRWTAAVSPALTDGKFAVGDYTITVTESASQLKTTLSCTVTVDPADPATWEVNGSTLLVPRGASAEAINASLLTGAITGIDLRGSGVTSIPAHAFDDCETLTHIELGSVTSIGDNAFAKCDSLSAVDLSGVTHIGSSAFLACTSLTSADLRSAVSLGYSAFSNCWTLTAVNLGSGITSIDAYVFQRCDELTSINLGHVTSIGNTAFAGCKKLANIDVRKVTSLGRDAFYDCDSLAAVDVSSAKTIGTQAFCDCEQLASIDLSSVEQISGGTFAAFENCPALTDIRLGSRLNGALPDIEAGAFASAGSGAFNVYADVSAEQQEALEALFDGKTVNLYPNAQWDARQSTAGQLLQGLRLFGLS